VSITFRNQQRFVLLVVVTAAFAIFFGYGAYTDPGEWAVIAVIEAALVVAFVRALRAGVQVTDDGLVIRDLLRTRTLAWSQIANFSPAPRRLHAAHGRSPTHRWHPGPLRGPAPAGPAGRLRQERPAHQQPAAATR